jgi:hypothetical protein
VFGLMRGGGRSKFAICAAVFVLGALVEPGPPASAAGNAGLQAEIVSDPLSHGAPLSSSLLGQFTSAIQSAESNAATESGGSASVAALGWTVTTAKPKRSFIVALSALDWPNMSSSQVDRQTALAAKSAAATTCAGELGSPPKVDVTVRSIPNSHYFECGRASDGSVLEGITTSRANVFAVIITDTVALSKHKLEAVTLKQYHALHSPDPSLTP